MPRLDNLVTKIVDKTAKAVQPDRIIRFGSRALGTARKDSIGLAITPILK